MTVSRQGRLFKYHRLMEEKWGANLEVDDSHFDMQESREARRHK